MLSNLCIYFLVLLLGLSLEQIVKLGKYDSKKISINDYIYLELSGFKKGDEIRLGLTFDSMSEYFNKRDFYIHYCQADSYINYTSCDYVERKQDEHRYNDNNEIDYDNDYPDIDYGDDYHYKFFSSFNYRNFYNYNIYLVKDKKYLLFYFTNTEKYYEDIFNLEISHNRNYTLIIVLVIVGIIVIVAGVILFIKIHDYCENRRYKSDIIKTPLFIDS